MTTTTTMTAGNATRTPESRALRARLRGWLAFRSAWPDDMEPVLRFQGTVHGEPLDVTLNIHDPVTPVLATILATFYEYVGKPVPPIIRRLAQYTNCVPGDPLLVRLHRYCRLQRQLKSITESIVSDM